jgi:ribosome-associated protein
MIEIPEQELVFKTSRSSGPGGQNVNKVSTRVTVLFDVANTACLSDSQKKRILRQLATRASKGGVIRVVSQRYRTQKANRRAAVERLQQLLRKALTIKPVRKKTRVPVWAKERRLEEKKRRSAGGTGWRRRQGKISNLGQPRRRYSAGGEEDWAGSSCGFSGLKEALAALRDKFGRKNRFFLY